ncbi:CoA transferase [Streptomyces sp. NPDC090442]|uniref:CoA transferase n=1 Tax=Streptomyces sp. NPDC090442 TaxID=3365962 RepID=UPI00380961F3
MTVEQQQGSSTAQGALEGLYRELGIAAQEAGGTVKIAGADPVTPSVHRIGDAAAAALAALGSEVAALHRERGGAAQDVTVSVEAAVRQLMGGVLHPDAGRPGRAAPGGSQPPWQQRLLPRR